MHWALGVYTDLHTATDTLTLYIDDLEIWEVL